MCKIIKSGKKIVDVRFVGHEKIVDLIEIADCIIATDEQKKMLLKAGAISKEKELYCHELYTRSLQDIPFIAREYRPFIAFNINFEYFCDSIKNIAMILDYKFKDWKQQNIRLCVGCVDMVQDKTVKNVMANLNIFITYNNNYQMWNKMFCIHIFDLKSRSIAHCADVLMTGTPVIAHTSMAKSLGIGEEYGLFAVENYTELLNMAITLHKDKDMWEKAAKNAFASKKIFASESYFSVLN